MPREVEVALPCPWWPTLTYETDFPLETGRRVLVPLGHSRRVGFAWRGDLSGKQARANLRLKKVSSVLDEGPCLTPDLVEVLDWLGNRLPYGLGHVIRMACPAPLLKGQRVQLPEAGKWNPGKAMNTFCYRPRFVSRQETYLEAILKAKAGCLLLFPDRDSLSSFFDFLPDERKALTCVWPLGGGTKLWEAWLAVRNGEKSIVMGTSGAVFAPVLDLSLVVVEEEADPSHQMPAFPRMSARTLASKRAALSGAVLVLGGTSPSSRVALLSGVNCREVPKGRVFFVKSQGAKAGSGLQTNSFPQDIPVSRKLREETEKCLSEGRNAFWLLDRKGYATEIRCTECDRTVTCRNCDGKPRWSLDSWAGVCLDCGETIEWPEQCPGCRGRLLEVRHPGLERSFEQAKGVFGNRYPVSLLSDYSGLGKKARKDLARKFQAVPALLLGTRALLPLCRSMDVGLIGWLDVDIEGWKPDYAARAEGFRTVWLSCWTGNEPDSRKIVLQSRKPKQGWQRGLEAGFTFFWERELSERKTLGLPPFRHLSEIAGDSELLSMIRKTLEIDGLEVFSGTRTVESLQVKLEGLEKFRGLLAPFFTVKPGFQDYPKISLDFE